MPTLENSRRLLQAAVLHVGLAAILFLLWWIRDALLLAFGAILAATLLRVIASWIARPTRVSDAVALAVAILLVAAVFGVAGWLFGSRMADQFSDLLHRFQTADARIKSVLQQSGIGGFVSKLEENASSMIGSGLERGLSTGLSAIEGAVVLIISAIYLAAQPALYRNGVILLFAPGLRKWARETIDVIGLALRQWLLGELILMLIVGVLSILALWLIGLPNPLALGVIAGIAEIVPYLGPFIGAIPAVVVGLTQGLSTALWTGIAYLLIHVLEGYLISPLLQRRLVTIPPVVILFGIVLADLLFGSIGVIFGAPLSVAVFIGLKRFYLHDVLERPVDDMLQTR